MFEIPEDILKFFFNEIKEKDKCNVEVYSTTAIIKPRKEQEHYKPTIYIRDLDDLRKSLIHYVESLNEFYSVNNNIAAYHDLSFFLRRLLLDMASSDADDFARYIDKRSCFFSNKHFEELNEPTMITVLNDVKFFAQRIVECPGLETPYVLIFTMEINGIVHQLPLVRYAFDENDTCHLFAIQYGRNRTGSFGDPDFKDLVDKVKSGGSKFRGVSPSFVLTFALFLMLLSENNINKLVAPDFLFGRYRTYYKATGEAKSDEILWRILNNFIKLFQRMELQIEGFKITYFPNDIDSYTHVQLGEMSSANQALHNI